MRSLRIKTARGELVGRLTVPDDTPDADIEREAARMVEEYEARTRWDPLEGMVRCGECPISAPRLTRREFAAHAEEHERVRREAEDAAKAAKDAHPRVS